MVTDRDGLRTFVADVLGGLAVDDERTRWLRETLREILAGNGSFVAMAEAMTLQCNMIQYRVA
jgi:sugar diacid utilization regulator